jgi:hypothetical protein
MLDLITQHFYRNALKNICKARKKDNIIAVCDELSAIMEKEACVKNGYSILTIESDVLEAICKKNNVTSKTFLQYVDYSVEYYYNYDEAFVIRKDEIYGENFTNFTETDHYSGLHAIETDEYYKIVDVKKRYSFFTREILVNFPLYEDEWTLSVFLWYVGNNNKEELFESPLTYVKDEVLDFIEFSHPDFYNYEINSRVTAKFIFIDNSEVYGSPIHVKYDCLKEALNELF